MKELYARIKEFAKENTFEIKLTKPKPQRPKQCDFLIITPRAERNKDVHVIKLLKERTRRE